jgi:hypothetical protein
MMHTPIVRLCEMDSRDGPCENLKYIDTIARNGNCPWINLFCLTTKMSETGLVIHRESKSILIGLGFSLQKSPLESIVYCRDLLKHSTWKRGGGGGKRNFFNALKLKRNIKIQFVGHR